MSREGENISSILGRPVDLTAVTAGSLLSSPLPPSMRSLLFFKRLLSFRVSFQPKYSGRCVFGASRVLSTDL